jgi:hypothetical protein
MEYYREKCPFHQMTMWALWHCNEFSETIHVAGSLEIRPEARQVANDLDRAHNEIANRLQTEIASSLTFITLTFLNVLYSSSVLNTAVYEK